MAASRKIVRLHKFGCAQRASNERSLTTGGLKLAVVERTEDFAEMVGACAQIFRGDPFRLRHVNHPTTRP